MGDVVYRDYDGFVMSEGAFGQVEYNKDKLSAFVAGSLSNTSYWRRDRFYYDADHEKSETVNFIGWTAKGGLNYNLTENHNVFANVGYIVVLLSSQVVHSCKQQLATSLTPMLLMKDILFGARLWFPF